MKALRFTERGQVGWEDAAAPRLTEAHGALLRPIAVARCDLDVRMVTDATFPGPYTVGHEFVARVVSVGPGVTRFREGDMVLVPFQPSCGECVRCRSARYAACVTFRAPAGAAFGFGVAGGDHDGAVSELVSVAYADHLLLSAPDLTPAALATLPDNVVDAYRAVLPAVEAGPDGDLLIVGGFAASVGLYAVAIATACNVPSVRYVDSDVQRCEAASMLGADVDLTPEWSRRFDRAAVTVENTGTQAGLLCALRSTADYGICTTTAIHFSSGRELPLLEMYTRGIRLEVGRADSRRYLPAVIDLATSGRFDPLEVPSEIVKWEDAAQTWLTPFPKLILVRD